MIKDFFIHLHSKKLIMLYLMGALPVDQRWSFEKHLSQCYKCRRQIQQEDLFNKKVFSACAPLGSAMNRTRSRLEELPNYYASEAIVRPKKIKRTPNWQVWNWQIPPSIAVSLVVVVILLLLGEYFSIGHFIPNLVGTTQFSGEVAKSLGEGLWLQNHTSPNWHKLSVKTQVNPGDNIRTDEYGRGLINLGKYCELWLNQSTQIRVMSNVDAAFEITSGEVYIALNQPHGPFQVKTPSGMVRVYGTQFQIAVDKATQKTKVSCFQHAVYFENPLGKVEILAGYESENSPQTKPSDPVMFDFTQRVYWKTQFDQLSLLSDEERKQLHQSFLKQGDMFFDVKAYDKALKLYQMAVILDPNDFIPYYGIGRVYRDQGQYTMATAIYVRMMDKNPNEYALNYQLAECLIELKQYRDAEFTLLHTIKKLSTNQSEWVLLGDCYVLQHSPDKAEQAFQNAANWGAEISKENYSQIHGGWAEIAHQRGDNETAIMEITKALQAQSIPSQVYAEAAWIYRDTKNLKGEKSAWENYLKLTPHGAFAEEARSRIKQMDSL